MEKFCNYCNKKIIGKHKGAKYCNVGCMALAFKNDPKEHLNKFTKLNQENGCIEWIGTKGFFGYGRMYFNGKEDKAHRVSYVLNNGEIPKGLFVCHKCDNPSCVNPEHLFLGTALDNNRDRILKGRSVHLSGEDVPTSKLTENQVKDIYVDDRVHTLIAKDFNVTRECVSSIKNKRSWKNVTDKIDCAYTQKDKRFNFSKLTLDDVKYIKNNKEIGVNLLADKFGVCEYTINRIIKGKTWKDV